MNLLKRRDISYANEKGTQNLINSVILTLDFADTVARYPSNRGKQLVFTGHSLGGFIASAAGRVSEARTVAWNAPGGVGLFYKLKKQDIQNMRVGRKVYQNICPNFKPEGQRSYHYYISRKHCPVASIGRHLKQDDENGVELNIESIWVDDVSFTSEEVDKSNGAVGFGKGYANFVNENHSIAILVWDLLGNQGRQDLGCKDSQDIQNMAFKHYKIGNHGVTALTDFIQLRYLNLTDNNLGDSSVTSLAQLINLTDLNLSHNELSLIGFIGLTPLVNLQKLNLSDNEIKTDTDGAFRASEVTSTVAGVASIGATEITAGAVVGASVVAAAIAAASIGGGIEAAD